MIARQRPESQAIIRLLLAKLAELEARLKELPRKSSLSPCTEHTHAKPPAIRPESGKKTGGRPGHLMHVRALAPVEQCQSLVTIKPDLCRRCGTQLAGADVAPADHATLRQLGLVGPAADEVDDFVASFVGNPASLQGAPSSSLAARAFP